MTSTMELAPAVEDPAIFAQALLGRPLWDHQAAFARSPARYRVMCAGRQVGKSTALAVVALHRATIQRGATVLLVSAGEVASRRLLEECASLATNSPLLRGSVLDESKSQLTLSTGSRIISVPASQRQIRGWPVDLLIVDEAGFIDPEIWRAAEPAIIARPGSRVVLSSTPWGAVDHFFRLLWRRGMDAADDQVASWHWPSSVSPLVDRTLLAQIRERETPEYFAREYEAEWTDESGSYFTEEEIRSAVAPYELMPLEGVRAECAGQRLWPAAGGVDWGMARDANVLVLLSPLEDHGLNRERFGDGRVLFVPYLVGRAHWPWDQFMDHVVEVCQTFDVQTVASETNGVGAWPTDDLAARLFKRVRGGTYGTTVVDPVWTDVRRKMTGFGKIKALLQSGRLVLPTHPELLKQLRSLQFEQLAGGNTRISVPESLGHDDLALGLCQAVSAVTVPRLRADGHRTNALPREVVETPGGVKVPLQARPDRLVQWFAQRAAGAERGEGW